MQHRRVADASPLAAWAAQAAFTGQVVKVPDLDFERALRALRWGDLARPGRPRVTVMWQDSSAAAPPQPSAVLVETPEPLWRWRDVPREVPDSRGTRRYQLRPQPWLDVVATSERDPLILGFVHSTDGARTLVMLQAAARGQLLGLELRRTHQTLFEGNQDEEKAALAAVSLATAPWEDPR